MDRQQHLDLGAIARVMIDSNFYMTLGTADENGRPWVSPVYYAHEGYANFYLGFVPGCDPLAQPRGAP
jgi:nitroimidazol reductase NimA-like FMN-containing flavoprotein (pyridoxamine 5'-phosphate oxidase superfamily)